MDKKPTYKIAFIAVIISLGLVVAGALANPPKYAYLWAMSALSIILLLISIIAFYKTIKGE